MVRREFTDSLVVQTSVEFSSPLQRRSGLGSADKPSSSNPPPLWDLNMTHSLWVKQYEWIQQDLIAANKNRDQRPWIVVHGHESLYCSCDEDCDATAAAIRAGPFGNSTYGLEQLLFDQGVDLWLNGHEHNVSLALIVCAQHKCCACAVAFFA